MPRPDNADISRSITSYVTARAITRRLETVSVHDHTFGSLVSLDLWRKTALLWRDRVRSDWGW